MIQSKYNDKLVVALDFDNRPQAEDLVLKLGDEVKFYKIGLELIFNEGLDLAERLRDQGKWIFLDMKFLDIGNTVEKAVRSVSRRGFDFLTVHGHDRKTLDAAVAGRENNLKLLAVTVLTNYEKADLVEQGIETETPGELAVRRAKMAEEAKFDGVIASGFEARAIRDATSRRFVIKTPGIRLPSGDVGDQVRVMTPQRAIQQGADYLVVGRPITQATDPLAATKKFRAAIKEAAAAN